MRPFGCSKPDRLNSTLILRWQRPVIRFACFNQRLAGDTAGAKLTAEQARKTFEPLYGNQPENPFLALFLSQAYADMGEKDSALK